MSQLRALSNWSQMVSGDLILCAAHSTLQLFSRRDSTQLILEQVYYSVGDMNTPWSGLCDNRLTQHWAARLSRICSDQLCNDGSIILLSSYMSTPLNLISHSFMRRDLEIYIDKVRHKTCWLLFL